MNQTAYGNIWIYAKVPSGYNVHVYTYVCNNPTNINDWHNTKELYVSNTNGQWIGCGHYWSNFQYLGIAAINDQGQAVNIYIDSAIVVPY
jgi:hypothetical protein